MFPADQRIAERVGVGHRIGATPTSIALPGSVGNGGSSSYAIVLAPGHGSATLAGATASYTAQAGYSGSESFGCCVQYGSAMREAEVDLAVIAPNQPPMALEDSIDMYLSTSRKPPSPTEVGGDVCPGSPARISV